MSASGKLAAVSNVEIDGSGRFKYVLIKVYQQSSGSEEAKFVVRGHAWGAYHADIYDDTSAKLMNMGLDTECVGGGRILHEPEKKSIKVYGYSQGFGLADHQKTCELLKEKYPDYVSITWSNEGY